MDRGRMMIPEFTVPYFSGAALYTGEKDWNFNLNEVDSLHAFQKIVDKQLSRDKINSYRFSSQKINTKSYSINQEGYLHVVRLATSIFSFTGDIGAVKYFQLFVHALVSLLIILLLSKNSDRLIFFCLYAVNPFIIYYVIYPFYYFWQMIPSAFLIYFLLSRKLLPFALLIVVSIVLAFLFHVRSSVLLISLVTLFFACGHLNIVKKIALFAIYLIAILFMQSKATDKHPGHIMYVSLGAYPNKFVNTFSDTVAWNAFTHFKGVQYSYASTPGMYDAEIFFDESKWAFSEYRKIAIENPLMILRNAGLNFFQSFSFGYFRSSLFLSYLSAFHGLIFFIILIMLKKYKYVIALIAASGTFIPYLAPLPVYLYGSYILLTMAAIDVFHSINPFKKSLNT